MTFFIRELRLSLQSSKLTLLLSPSIFLWSDRRYSEILYNIELIYFHRISLFGDDISNCDSSVPLTKITNWHNQTLLIKKNCYSFSNQELNPYLEPWSLVKKHEWGCTYVNCLLFNSIHQFLYRSFRVWQIAIYLVKLKHQDNNTHVIAKYGDTLQHGLNICIPEAKV